MTSMTKELGRSVPISEVKEPLTRIFGRIFDTELERTDAGALDLRKKLSNSD